MPLTAGTRLGAYEILGQLGAGGMGEVYQARDLRLQRDVAIKVLPPHRLGDEARRRFVREAQAASALNHPHIVTIHEIESADDQDFIVMEYVRGRSLDTAIPRGGLPLPELLRIAIPVADALAAAHARGIVHRDLKPANVMTGSDGAVKVLDFGLAKHVGRDDGAHDSTFTREADPALSVPGTIAGTAAYMSPEQATGGTVDARSDIFSFGAMLYEMATGTRAFGGTTSVADTLAAVIRAQPKPPTDIVPALPRELERLILRCLRKEPDRRYQTIRDVSLELQEIKEESDSGRLSASVPAGDLPRRGRLKAAVVVAAVAVVAAFVVVWRMDRKAGSDGPSPRLVPLTALAGREWHPTLSPDGEQVAFQWDGEKQDNEDIYLKLVGSSELRRLTTDAGHDSSPAWSPDGREIAFLRRRQDSTTLYAVSPITGAERKIADLASSYWGSPSWSADGRWLAVNHIIPRQGGGIYLAPVQGGTLRTLMTARYPFFFAPPRFSPDGRALAFMTCRDLRCSLEVLALDATLEPAGAARTLLKDLQVDKALAAWAVDGRSLIYTNAGYLWRVPVTGGNAPERLELAGFGAFSPAVAAKRLAFVFQRDTISQHPLDMTHTSPPVLASSFWDIDANFSPDGQRLVFSSSRAGEWQEIWTARADGTGARQLLRGPGTWQGSPSFSPDGRQVAFDSRHEDGSWSIFVVDADGGVPRQLTTQSGDENMPKWSSDGRWIYYTSDRKAGRNVWRIPAAGGHPEQLTTSGTLHRVQIAPDGHELLFTPRNGRSLLGGRELLAAPIAGGVPRPVLPCVRTFAANAIGVYYTACGPGPERDMHLVEAATARDSVIGRTRDTTFGLSADTPTVSPDGKSVLVSRSVVTRDLMLIENFR